MDLVGIQQQLSPLTADNFEHSSQESLYFSEYGLDFEKQLPDVRHCFGYVDSCDYRIACHLYLKEQATASVVILHGYFDHSGYFKHIIRFFLNLNCNVLIYDLPGHGLSTGKPASIPDFSVYSLVLGDLQNYCESMLPKPWYGFGQSTGGAILTEFVLERTQHNKPVPFDRLILSAPLVRPRLWNVNRWQLYVMRFFIRQMPRKFTCNSRDASFITLSHKDPLTGRHLPVEWLMSMDRWIKRIEKIKTVIPMTPVIIQGTHDGTIDAGYNIARLQQIYNGADVLWLENARHHLPNEIEETRQAYFLWLKKYLRNNSQIHNE